MDFVEHIDSAVFAGSENVAVMPEAVGADALFVDEHFPRLDVGQLREPREPNKRGDADGVQDDLASEDGQLHRLGTEAHFRRSDLVEVVGIGKEIPGVFYRGVEALLAAEGVNFHCVMGETFRGCLADATSIDESRLWFAPFIALSAIQPHFSHARIRYLHPQPAGTIRKSSPFITAGRKARIFPEPSQSAGLLDSSGLHGVLQPVSGDGSAGYGADSDSLCSR